jgi:hypothetical protein
MPRWVGASGRGHAAYEAGRPPRMLRRYRQPDWQQQWQPLCSTIRHRLFSKNKRRRLEAPGSRCASSPAARRCFTLPCAPGPPLAVLQVCVRCEEINISGGMVRQKAKYERFLRKRSVSNPRHGAVKFRCAHTMDNDSSNLTSSACTAQLPACSTHLPSVCCCCCLCRLPRLRHKQDSAAAGAISSTGESAASGAAGAAAALGGN